MVNKMDVRKVNEELVSFWNNAIKMDDSQKQEIEKSEFECIELAPSEKLCKAIETYKYAKHMLDYGCGNGWASIIGAKSGIEKVTSVDMGDAIIDSCKFLSHKFKVDGKIDAFKIDEDWLKKEEDEKYDFVFCSNVLDVVPEDTSNMIIKELSRVLKRKGNCIIGLNFYMSKDMAKERNIELVGGRELYVNNVLRLVSFSDEEWKEKLEKYFEVSELRHFAWPGEKEERRRLFILKKRDK